MALYARVSTRDKDQNPETQLMRLRDFTAGHSDWHITKEYVDIASANDLGHRTAWKALTDDAIKHKFDAVLVFKLDRAFRSVRHMHDTLAVWDPLHIGFLSAQEGFDTTTALGRLLLNLLASLAEFELEMIRERVTAGMDRARKEGKVIGRPKLVEDPETARRLNQAVRAVQTGELSYRKAATKYQVSVSSIQRARSGHIGQLPADAGNFT
ncbi:recombinase family protein [Sulfobacillus sp. DSM 109850]|uniref:Recombinase family protein n=1 Tax=Sulfobacillus harzensis TaxID=2729629 RepID=A0A7Y0L5R2_9FIRM|nr:recombinase family protein [Sulfobacillus harzensis]